MEKIVIIKADLARILPDHIFIQRMNIHNLFYGYALANSLGVLYNSLEWLASPDLMGSESLDDFSF